MSDIKVTQLLDIGDDVLLVRGERVVDETTIEIQARGWVSALDQHYPDEAYDGDGNRLEDKKGEPKVKPRAMSSAERRAYAERLLAEQNPVARELPL